MDFGGYAPVVLHAYQPRAWQWMLFRLSDASKHIGLAERGAWCARDGSLVGIVVPGPSPYLQLVDADGLNFTVSRDERPVSVFFYLDSPTVCDLHPMTSLADFPPGRAYAPGWTPQP